MSRKDLGRLFLIFAGLGIGVGVVASAQLSKSIRAGSLNLTDNSVVNVVTSAFQGEPDPAEPPLDPEADGTAALPRSMTPSGQSIAQVVHPTEPPPSLPAQCREVTANADVAVAGDRLRLRFFERTTLSTSATGVSADTRDVAYERLDLSGIYEVDSSGEVSVPLVGRLGVAGMTMNCVELAVSRATYDASAISPVVTASFETRPMIVVRGAVRAPGGYQHDPGMTVELLLARAGSPSDGGIADAQHFITLLSRQADLDRSAMSITLKQRRARALLDDVPLLELTESEIEELDRLFGPDRLATERTALSAEFDLLRAEDARLESKMQDLSKIEDETRQMYSTIQTQYEDLTKRRDELVTLKERGYASAVQLDGVSFNVITVERELLDLQKALSKIQSDANEAIHQANVEVNARRRELTEELRSLSAETASLKGEREVLEAELAMYDSGLATSGKGLKLSLAITRTIRGRSETIDAELSTPVLPGDLLTVSAVLPRNANGLSNVLPEQEADADAQRPRQRNPTLQ